MTNSQSDPSFIERNPWLSRATTILLYSISAIAILFGVWSIYSVRSLQSQLKSARAELASSQKNTNEIQNKLSADEEDIKQMCKKVSNISNIIHKPESAPALESFGADFLTDHTFLKSVACRLEVRIQ